MRWGWFWFLVTVCLVVLWIAGATVTTRVPCDRWHFGDMWQPDRKCVATFTNDTLTGVSWDDD